jgi:hypothetical protein
MFWDAPIKNEGAKEVPYPTGLDNCAAAGIVELYWDAVTWPTLTGYNLYRKESTEPSYDFKAPLNSQPLTGTYFEDKSVATDGTSYDYVVTSVDLDSTESLPSNQTTADPQYRTPSGFTDLEAPDDGTIGDQVVLNTVSAAVDGKGKVYVVWDHDVDWPTFGISLANGNMLDGTSGATFEVGEGDNPDVAFDSKGNAHVVWGFGSGDGANPKEYYYAEVDPSGSVSNLTKLHTFTYGNWWSVQPTIAVTPDDEVHIVFTGYLMKYGIVYVHGAPGNFSEPEMLASNVTAFLAMADPDLVSDHDGNLHLIWIGPDFATLNYMKRDTSGAWSDQVVAAQAPDFQEIYRPGLAVDRLGVVHISWNQQDPNGVNYPYYIDNRSGAFENPLQLETEVITNGAVQIACDRDGNAYVIWYTDLDPGSGFNWQSFVGLVDWNGDIIAKQKVSSDTGYSGVMPVIAGVTDTCFAGEASVIGVWAARPDLPPQFGRIRTDY